MEIENMAELRGAREGMQQLEASDPTYVDKPEVPDDDGDNNNNNNNIDNDVDENGEISDDEEYNESKIKMKLKTLLIGAEFD